MAGEKHGSPSAVMSTTTVLAPLPYATTALKPYISEQTLKIHHGEHHRRYVDQLGDLIRETPFEKAPLEKIITATRGGKLDEESIHMLSSLIWNHNLYWKSMTPKGGGAPKGVLDTMIQDSFKSMDAFKEQFLKLAMQIGVGWVWLMHNQGRLTIVRTEYHESPLFLGIGTPLLIKVPSVLVNRATDDLVVKSPKSGNFKISASSTTLPLVVA